ncbi:acyltransferase [Cupriavidus sp. D384]|uniref:acyltransferase family protein n=1 Tax=Cupriavidus sp. D384 TaxID=1538095 RepID=UPI00082E4B23|nr:acyltransferase [Cupriavidus sp. D384]
MTQDTSFLNGLRAFAAYWVLTAHCMIWGGWWANVPFPAPKIAVDVFMVLSGFLMAYTVSARSDKEPMAQPRNWIPFYVRRYFRLAPAYYLSLGLAVLLAGEYLTGYAELRALNPAAWQGDWVYDPMRTQYTFSNILLHLSFLFGLFPTYSFSTFLPDWSLSLEIQFYVAFPIIYVAMRRFGAARIAVALAVLCYLVKWGIDEAIGASVMSFYYEPSLLFFRLPIFLAGVLVFEATRPGLSQLRQAGYIALAIAFCFKMIDIYKIQVFWLVVPTALMAVFVLPYAPIASRLHWLSKICRSRLVTFLSDVSYPVYLFHGFFLAIVGSRIGHAAQAAGYSLAVGTIGIWIAVFVLTTCFAYVVYRAIELPGIRIGGALLSRARRPHVSGQVN